MRGWAEKSEAGGGGGGGAGDTAGSGGSCINCVWTSHGAHRLESSHFYGSLCRAATRRRCGGSDEPPGKSPARPPCVPVGTFPAPQWPALMVPRSGTCPYDNRARVPTSAPAAPATLRCTRSAPAPIVGVSLPAAAIHAATFFAKHPTHVCPPRSAVFRPLPTVRKGDVVPTDDPHPRFVSPLLLINHATALPGAPPVLPTPVHSPAQPASHAHMPACLRRARPAGTKAESPACAMPALHLSSRH